MQDQKEEGDADPLGKKVKGHKVKEVKLGDLSFDYIGQECQDKALPALFYFALSANESLSVDPINQPVTALLGHPLRIFSLNLPGHGKDLPSQEGMRHWAEQFKNNQDPLTPFIESIVKSIEALVADGLAPPEKIALMGLSRGSFIALHVAARLPFIRTLVCFAPLLDLSFSSEFEKLEEHPLVENLDPFSLVPALCDRQLRFYIGNVDRRVGTERTFQFVQQLCSAATQKGIRSPQIELVVTPSIGFLGHGTSKESFEAGAAFIAQKLGVSHE
jgi:pimeloyl-ACP methyl ester carboxylesterase